MKSDDLLSRLKSQCRCMSQPAGKCFSCQAITHIEELEAAMRDYLDNYFGGDLNADPVERWTNRFIALLAPESPATTPRK